MCGLIATRSALPPSADRVELALAAIAHRGPDGRGTWSSPDGKVVLGHARLSIIDLEGGNQPLVNEDGRIAAVVTGEFYGFEAIRSELRDRGHLFRSASDSEILLHLYEQHGFNAIKQLRGEFAFVLWDDRRKHLLAGRDRFGIKPLFYAEKAGDLLLASEMKALFAHGIAPGWDEDAMHQHLLACMAEDRSLFAGIRQVPPGCVLIATESGITIRRYWEIDYPADAVPPVPPNDKDLIAALQDAVSTRLVSDVPVGCMLSGGLDSSLVLSLAGRQGTEGMAAFTATFDHPIYNEVARAREAAAHAGAVLHEIEISNNDMATHFADAIWHGESLCFNGHVVARYLLAREIRRAGIKTVLAGEGADELFAGYLFSVADAVNATGTPQERGRPPALLSGLAETRAPIRRLLAKDFTAKFSGHNPIERLVEEVDACRVAHCHPVIRSLYVWERSLLPQYVLAAERLDMAHGLEVRQPLLDHVLFDQVRLISGGLLVEAGTTKAVLRRLAAPFVPPAIAAAPKHPFTAPPATLNLASPLMECMQDLLRGGDLEGVPFFNRSAVLDLLDALPDMTTAQRIANDASIMMIASVCVLQKRIVATGAAR